MKTLFLGLGLLLSLGTGCKSVAKFTIPKEFEGQKLKEDPPGTMLPVLKPEMATC